MADTSSVQRRAGSSLTTDNGGQTRDGRKKKDGALERQFYEEVSRKKKRAWWWRWLGCGPVKFLALFIAIPFVLNYASLSREARELKPEGDLIDIGWGQKMFIRCSQGKGKLTVVLDTPVGETSDVWSRVEPMISKYARVCVYDRAGLGFSDRGYKNTSQVTGDYSEEAMHRDRSPPGTVERAADDLHRVLTKIIGEKESVFLVGVEYSSMVARFYTQIYEHHVAGLLLIDPLVETLFDKNSSWQQHWYSNVLRQVNTLYLSSSLGLTRLSLLLGLTKPVENVDVARLMNKQEIGRKKYLLCQSTHLSSVIDELALTNESMHQMKAMFRVKPFPTNLPITVAMFQNAVNLPDELIKEWRTAQEFLATSIHPNSYRATLPGADPLIFYQQPVSVAQVILTAIENWKNPQY